MEPLGDITDWNSCRIYKEPNLTYYLLTVGGSGEEEMDSSFQKDLLNYKQHIPGYQLGLQRSFPMTITITSTIHLYIFMYVYIYIYIYIYEGKNTCKNRYIKIVRVLSIK